MTTVLFNKTDFSYDQETALDILRSSECEDLGSELEANSSMELCTGSKKPFPKIEIYKLRAKKGFEFTGTEVDYLSGTKRKYDFYLGGTDSCQGMAFI